MPIGALCVKEYDAPLLAATVKPPRGLQRADWSAGLEQERARSRCGRPALSASKFLMLSSYRRFRSRRCVIGLFTRAHTAMAAPLMSIISDKMPVSRRACTIRSIAEQRSRSSSRRRPMCSHHRTHLSWSKSHPRGGVPNDKTRPCVARRSCRRASTGKCEGDEREQKQKADRESREREVTVRLYAVNVHDLSLPLRCGIRCVGSATKNCGRPS
jgi:hypothetical protein